MATAKPLTEVETIKSVQDAFDRIRHEMAAIEVFSADMWTLGLDDTAQAVDEALEDMANLMDEIEWPGSTEDIGNSIDHADEVKAAEIFYEQDDKEHYSVWHFNGDNVFDDFDGKQAETMHTGYLGHAGWYFRLTRWPDDRNPQGPYESKDAALRAIRLALAFGFE